MSHPSGRIGHDEMILLNKLGHLVYGVAEVWGRKLEIVDAVIVHADGTLEDCSATGTEIRETAISLVAKIMANQDASGYVVNSRDHKVRIVNGMWAIADHNKGRE